ncbi:P-loop NTPase fold protein [Kribbella sp. NPDC056861]|uniref:P-loop NTPase fold protein n=1 Tax=Kribbella sp. NPDC056861 TaxID=3154857 RepID=UPI00342F328C
MASQQQVRAEVQGHEVELVLGDIFESDADFLVVPVSTSGSMAPEFSDRLTRLGGSPPTGPLKAGEVKLAGRLDGSGQQVLLAAGLTYPEPVVEAVQAAAHNVAAVVEKAGGSVAFPLLGAGSGGLSAAESLEAIVTGYGEHRGSSLRVHIVEPDLYQRMLDFAAPTASEGPEPEASEAQAASESHPSASQSASGSISLGAPSATAPDSAAATAQSVQPASPQTTTRRRREELVPTHTDGPASVDELGRQGFARVLARRIRDARKEEQRNSERARDLRSRRGGSFIVHLHAPWGAGKTSVLNFLAAELRKPDETTKDKRSVVVEFNAWRHQRIEPPWWWLMTALYSGAVRDLDTFDRRRGLLLRLREWLWRSKGGWPGYLALLLVAAAVTAAWRAGWFGAAGNEDLLSPDSLKGVLVTAAAIITPALTIWGLLHAMGRWVFTTSARGARRFLANTSDPMRLVQEHLADLTDWIHHDVVVMIDDLDRCKGPYVVELLEGIQTLFRDVPVTYVIAADRDWLADSYAAEYSGFVSGAGEVGRPIGYLFLEKTFQISTGLPQAGKRLDTFWGRILRSPSVPDEQELAEARTTARRELGGKQSREARAEVRANPGRTPADEQARLETLAVEMVSERAQRQNTHTLEPFRALLGRDPNPRAMKRLVNAYGIARGIETLQGVNLEDNHVREQETALWTILTLRWPKLAGHLARYPEHLKYAVPAASASTPSSPRSTPAAPASTPTELPSSIPADLRPLFADPELHAVVQGEGVAAALTPEILAATTLR